MADSQRQGSLSTSKMSYLSARIDAHENSSRCEIFDRHPDPATDTLGRPLSYGDLGGLVSILRLWSFGKPEPCRLRPGAMGSPAFDTLG
jgi:hypothetical protein